MLLARGFALPFVAPPRQCPVQSCFRSAVFTRGSFACCTLFSFGDWTQTSQHSIPSSVLLCTTNCTLYFLFVHINVKIYLFYVAIVIRQLECYANSRQYGGDFLCMLCVIYLARNRCGFCFGGQITFKRKYNSLEFDELKQTGFLGPLITWGVWQLSARLSEVPLYCNDGFTSVPFQLPRVCVTADLSSDSCLGIL